MKPIAPRPIITLTTDFGLSDPWVGQVKGVILGHCPEAVLVDLSHDVPPQDVLRAGLILSASAESFPPETIHLAVVDPGVGTGRRVLALRANSQQFVAPDNGLLTPVLRRFPEGRLRALTNADWLREPVSPTFHGRDVFAPLVGRLASGRPAAEVGPRVNDPTLLDLPLPALKDGRFNGRILFVDRFGNLITNLPAEKVLNAPGDQAPRFHLAGQTLTGVHLTYAEKDRGRPLVLVGSLGLIEVAVNQGRADEFFGLKEGDAVEVEL